MRPIFDIGVSRIERHAPRMDLMLGDGDVRAVLDLYWIAMLRAPNR